MLAPGAELTDDLIGGIHAPSADRSRPATSRTIVDVVAIPSSLTGKKLQVPIKRLLQGVAPGTAVNRATVANPDVLDWNIDFAAKFRAGRSPLSRRG